MVIWGLRQIEKDYSYIVMFWGQRICKENVVRTLEESRCEKNVSSTDSNLISYVFQFSTAVQVAEDLISFTDLLVNFRVLSVEPMPIVPIRHPLHFYFFLDFPGGTIFRTPPNGTRIGTTDANKKP